MSIEYRMTGPVAITGADGHVGQALQSRLADLPNPIRALGRSDDWTPAITDAEAVIHLAGTLQPKRPNTYQAANVETTKRVLDAAGGGGVQRIVFLSYVGADPNSDNDYLRAKGQAEDLIAASGIPFVVFRSTFICGDLDDIGPSFASYQTETGETVSVLGDGTQTLAPIHVGDLTAFLAAAALEPSAPNGIFEVSGPELFVLDDFIRSINPTGIKIRHLPGAIAKPLAWFLPQLTPALVDVLLSDSVASGDPTQTADQFGASLHALSDLVAVSEEVAS